jgi:hypothetical protein
MDWDEAIYCPNCFGDGKVALESDDKSSLKGENCSDS